MRLNSARADRVTAVILLGLGIAMVWAGWTMDRLEVRRIHPASIPGLVPMLLGVALALCGGLLFRSARDPEANAAQGSLADLGWAATLCLAYAMVLVGNLPFVLATAIFVAAFLVLFDRDRALGPRFVTALLYGGGVAAAVAALFRYAFLVRLP